MKFIFQIIAGLVMVSLLTSTIVFYKVYHKEKALREKLDVHLTELKTQLKVSEGNNEQLKYTGEDFIKTMFTYTNKTFKEAKKATLELLSSKGKEKYIESLKPSEEDEPTAEIADFAYDSTVKIKESYYKRIDAGSALIEIQFDHSLLANKVKSSIPYEAKVWITNKNGKWKVEKYELKQVL